MLFKLTYNIINFSMTLSISFLVMTTFYGIIEIFRPIQSLWLGLFMGRFNIPYTAPNIVVTLSTLTLVIPGILSRTYPLRHFVCWNYNGKTPTPEQQEYLDKIINNIKEKAGIPEKTFKFYVSENDVLNAMAVGDNMIWVSKKLLDELTEAEVAGIIAHEVGHIENKDTNAMLLNFALNVPSELVIGLYYLIKMALDWLKCIPVIGWPLFIFSWIIGLFIWFNKWFLQIPNSVVDNYGSRVNEFNADLYACQTGFAQGLYDGLQKITKDDKEITQGQYHATHPATRVRLKRIKDYIKQQKEQYYNGNIEIKPTKIAA